MPIVVAEAAAYSGPSVDKACSENVRPRATALGVEMRFAGAHHARLRMIIEPDAFPELVRAMLRSYPEEALKAFGRVIAEGMPKERPPTGLLWEPLEGQKRIAESVSLSVAF